jgi:hypothetical protein
LLVEEPQGVPAEPDWGKLVTDAAGRARTHVVAQRHERGLTTASRPQLFQCDDGNLYAVKFRNNQHGDGRAVYTEQVVGLLGHLIGAPVPEVGLVNVTAELLAPLNIDLGGQPAAAGIHHGSRWAYGYSDRDALIRYPDQNRRRFAALHILYSWLHCADDHQAIFRNTEPHDVLSVDHSRFLPGGFEWSAQGLRDHQDLVQLDANFVPLDLSDDEHGEVLDRLAAVTAEAIADVAAAPPDDWGVCQSDKVAFAEYVACRQVQLLAKFGRTAG